MDPARLLLHTLFEMLGIGLGFRWFLRIRRAGHPTAGHPGGVWVLVGGILGAAVGSWALDAAQLWGWHQGRGPLSLMAGGRTVVGGLLGGWAGVELAKARVGMRGSTGDAMVRPLALGMALGRVGCLLAGPGDLTWGGPSDLPWAVTGPDGVARHPTPIYDMIFLGAVALGIEPVARRLRCRQGERFLGFLALYLAWRLVTDGLKPPFAPGPPPTPDLWGSLTPIQWASAAGALLAVGVAARRRAAG